MKLKDIQIDGFGVWTGLSVDSLPEGMTLFYGPNEAGKTTVMQFLRAMFYGFTDERRGRYLPPIHGGTPGGAIRVTGPGGGYEISRHSQLTDADVTGRLSVTGSDGLSQGTHRLMSLLGGVDEAIFTNVFAIGIRELQELATLDGTAAADELYKLSSGLDRVSLVDVLRSLRAGRKSLVGTPETEKTLLDLVQKRDRLRVDIQKLSGGTRRWSELATQRRTQSQEIEALRGRVTAWEKEARTVEVATNVFDTWREREEITRRIAKIEADAVLPDEAPSHLIQIDASMQEHAAKIEEIRAKRQQIRDKAEQLPINRRLADLRGRIDAAGQQATWVEALAEQIERLDGQIDKARRQVESDADRIGLDESERARLLQGDHGPMPDLSKQTLSALSPPARTVKQQLFALKQVKAESKQQKTRADKLAGELEETLQRAGARNLQQAIRRETETISVLRQRQQLSEHLDKLVRHYKELERESVDLTTDEALSIDRSIFLSLPFLFGGAVMVYGLFNLFEVESIIGVPDPMRGILCVLFGFMALLVYYLADQKGQRSTAGDLEDCERQIESLRRQIRETESDRAEVDGELPTAPGDIEVRLRQSEHLLADLEAALPTYHAHQAAAETYKQTRLRGTKAVEGLKAARREWSRTLESLGLAQTLSPKSIRVLGDGYETLQTSMRRLEELQTERTERLRERSTIAKRIEALYLEAIDAGQEHDAAFRAEMDDFDTDEPAKFNVAEPAKGLDRHGNRSQGSDRNARTNPKADARQSERPARHQPVDPLAQLNHLNEELSRQAHWIKRRRELKDQDSALKKQHSAHARSVERSEQQRRALWAKCGVATGEQFYALVDLKSQLSQLREEHEGLDGQIRNIIGGHLDAASVAKVIDGATATDLERRWESLTQRISETETRIASLQTSQGELAASMRQLGEDDRLMTARLELGCIERKLDGLIRRWRTMATASVLLEDVCATFESQRQPETLREASSFLSQLTDGKYTRIWTPLGTDSLKIDDAAGHPVPLDVLSRGTGEAVFMALRLSLAASYARRGVMLPLILDDVLVNFDGERAYHAAKTLRTFAELGHQVMMFTCHQHIVEIFHEIGVEVRGLPAQGTPGRAHVLPPPADELDDEPAPPPVVKMQPKPQPEPIVVKRPEPLPIVEIKAPAAKIVKPKPEPKPVSLVMDRLTPTPRKSQYQYAFRSVRRRRRPAPVIQLRAVPRDQPAATPKPAAPPRPVMVPSPVAEETLPPRDVIGWAWFQREPADGVIDEDEAAAAQQRDEYLAREDRVGVGVGAGQTESWWDH